MKSVYVFVLGVLVLAVTCDSAKPAVSRQRREDVWIWNEYPAPSTSSIPTIPTQKPTPSIPSTTPNEGQINLCIKTCPRTTEYNPVCGTDGKTYHNKGKFKCARLCGAGDLQIRYDRPCTV